MKISRIVYMAVFTVFACYVCTTSVNAQEITETYCSTDVPIVIPVAGFADDSVLNISDQGEIINVIVKLQIDHTFRDDLDVILFSPDMTTIELLSDVGGSGDNFGDECSPMPNFVLDDSAAFPVTDFSSGDPPAGTYRPEEPLSTFNGEEQSGIWTLLIFADAGGDLGRLNCWCLEITRLERIRNVPTLSEWGLIAMAGILGIVGLMVIRRRKVTA